MPDPSMEDVNRQHMATMGMDPASLGKPTEVPDSARDTKSSRRCSAVNPASGHRCAMVEGHSYDEHIRGKEHWPNTTGRSTELSDDEKLQKLQTSLGWSLSEGEIVLDADGWRHGVTGFDGTDYPGSKDFGEPITHNEYLARSAVSMTTPWSANEPTRTPGRREGDQVLPTGDESILDDQTQIAEGLRALADDVMERRRLGIERYGQGHRPFNGRNTIQDAYDEGVDQTVYLGSLLRARAAHRDELQLAVERVLSDKCQPGTYTTIVPEIATTVVDRVLDYVTIKIEEGQHAVEEEAPEV